jgi:hypothetical protein
MIKLYDELYDEKTINALNLKKFEVTYLINGTKKKVIEYYRDIDELKDILYTLCYKWIKAKDIEKGIIYYNKLKLKSE